ncbi:hypothetical protein BDN72DRAFT_375937 [Pluteus cervinus]|uniref:Uncharacterized protein n=1 Tax=Pluteus cervinus TaxID=181527 RepID=A0ACD3AA53_9AGAR|nr:hypothetical protein BDN72DRAFT_375937 [Pluteus cervinus]
MAQGCRTKPSLPARLATTNYDHNHNHPTMITDVPVLKDARAKIGAKIRALRDRIRSPSLRSSRNSTPPPIHCLPPPIQHLPPPIHSLPPPIHCLSPEIMTQIFMWVQLLYHGRLDRNTMDVGPLPKWIQVTRVCRYWRGVALSSKDLYTTILTHNHRYSQGVLERSGSATLSLIDTLDHYGRFWENEDLRVSVVAALPRVRNLWLRGESSKLFLPHIEKSNIPFQELCIYGWSSFPTTMFPISLRYLRLDWCFFSSYEWLSRLSNMVELTLIPALNSEEIHVDVLLNILDGMPRLISLELSSVSESTHVGQHGSQVKPILQYLKTSGLLGSIAQLLPRLTFAPRFKIDLSLCGDDPKGDLLPTIFEQIGCHVRASSMILRTVRQTLTAPDPYKYIETSIYEGKVEPCIHLSRMMDYRRMPLPFMKCVEALPFDDVVSLIMDVPCDADDWDDSLGYCSTVARLVLHNRAATLGFLEYLIVATEAEKGRHSGAYTPFKSLEELILHNIVYDRYLESEVQVALTARSERGFKLRKLGFHGCIVSADSIKKLSEVVDVVEQQRWP